MATDHSNVTPFPSDTCAEIEEMVERLSGKLDFPEDTLREVVTRVTFAVGRLERDRAARGRVATNDEREDDRGRRYFADWMKAASTEQRQELNAFRKTANGIEEIDAWLHEHEPKEMRHD